MSRIEPVVPKFLVKNISRSDLLVLDVIPIRPGQTIDVYRSAEYHSDSREITNRILRDLEMPSGDLYVKWKVKRKIEILEFQNPIYQGSGLSANKLQTANAGFDGGVLGLVSGKMTWVSPATSTNSIRFTDQNTIIDFVNDFTILVDASAGERIVEIPTPDVNGYTFNIKKVDASTNKVVLVPVTGSIDGDSSKSLIVEWHAITIQSWNGNWFIV
jgi:hypothetical protein